MEYVYWEGLSLDVAEYVENCLVCSQHCARLSQQTYQLILPGFAFQIVSIDVVGPLCKTSRGAQFIVVAIDHLTKWVKARTMSSHNGLQTLALFSRILLRAMAAPVLF